YLRARVYEYRFTTPEERGRTGDWWRREWKGEYIPPISLRPLSQRRHPRVSVFWLSVRANPRPSGRARATPAY
ncbi:MAG: lipase maturation factor family protein, partial [Acidobacteria bacterium]|nr:lipase maturation factor family protein [Acidobacteriota bacterium]